MKKQEIYDVLQKMKLENQKKINTLKKSVLY